MGMHVDLGGVPRAAQDEIDQSDVIDDGVRIRHADDGGDAARGRRLARGRERLAMLIPGLAGEHQHVDQAGGEDVTATVDQLGIADVPLVHLGAEFDNLAVGNDDATGLVEP